MEECEGHTVGGVRGACASLSGVMVALEELQVIGDVKGAAVLGSLGTKGLKADLDRVEGS